MERGNTPDVESNDDGDDANGDAKKGAGNVQRGNGANILKTTIATISNITTLTWRFKARVFGGKNWQFSESCHQ